MINIEELVAKAGGPFKLVTLFQKRMRELQGGAPPLVDPAGKTLQEIVAAEILENKTWLLPASEAKRLREERKETPRLADAAGAGG